MTASVTGPADLAKDGGAAEPASRATVGRMRFYEFILLMAALMSMLALSLDIMLPALPAIEAEMPGAAGVGEYVIFAILIGMAATPIPMGLLADAYGRRAPLIGGLALFGLGSVVCVTATSFETLLFGRFLQGAGVVGARIIAVAVVRDLFDGRRMARVMSTVMAFFVLVPAVAPAIGLAVEDLFGWRGVFAALGCLGAALIVWILLRLPETLPPAQRRAIRGRVVAEGLGRALSRRRAMGAIIASCAIFAAFMAYIGTAQHVFGEIYGFGDDFVFVFGAVALFIGAANLLNARIVERIGVRVLLGLALRFLIMAAAFGAFVFSLFAGPPPVWLYLFWCAVMAFAFALIIGNVNALAMHYLGDVAGLGAAIATTCQNLIGALGGAAIASFVIDDPTPLLVGFGVGAMLCLLTLTASDGAPGEAEI